MMMTKTKLNKPRSARSLTTTLAIAFFILSMVILLVNGGLALFTNIQSNQDAISSKQQLIAQDAAKIVASSIEQKFTGLETVVDLADPVNVSAETRKTIMESLLGHDPAFRQFVLLNSRGQQLAQVSRASQTMSSQSILQLKGDVIPQTSTGQRYISTVYIDDASGEPLITIAIPVKNVFGDFQGTLIAEVNLKFMWELVDQLQVGETGYAYVVDNKGKLIAFGDTGRVVRGENVGQIFEVKEFIQNPSASTDVTPEVGNYTGLLGATVVGTYVPLGTPEWAVVTELPTAEANQPIIGFIRSYIISMLAFAVLAGVAGILIARRLSAPLIDLSNAATEFAGGNLAVQAKVAGPAEIAQVASTFNMMTSRLRDLISSLEQRVADRTKALATSSEVSRRLSTILDRSELVAEVVNQVKNAFGYYHTQIYFYDEANENLVMAGGTGEAGEKMLAQFHKIQKGRGLVGRAAESNQAVLVSDTLQDANWLPNPLLPETKSEVAIPISLGNQVLGVLDVQQNITDGLKQEDVNSLQSIANQVAVAMQNIRQYENTQKIAADMGVVANVGIATSTITEAGHLLQEVVDLSKRSFNLYHAHIYLLNETGDFLELASGAGEVGRQMVAEKRRIPFDSEQSLVARAARTQEGVVVNDVTAAPDFLPNPLLPDTRSEMAVPMLAAGKTIGVLDVQSELANRFTEVDVSIQTTLASQIAVALQNAHSFSQSQRQAQRETSVNLITQKIQNATSVEAALKIAARELGHALGMKSTMVELNPAAPAGENKNN
jgi:GAF domain-containing protein/HAMP domain-containing protein